MIREYDSWENGMRIPTDNRDWELAAGNGHIEDGVFYLDGHYDWAVWVPKN